MSLYHAVSEEAKVLFFLKIVKIQTSLKIFKKFFFPAILKSEVFPSQQ